jgi:SAM-dependent methyltransferase
MMPSQKNGMTDSEVPIICPFCHKELQATENTEAGSVDICPHATITQGVIRFGVGYSDDVAAHRVAEVATEEAKAFRRNHEKLLADYCERVIEEYSTDNQRRRFISLGCGAGYDVAEFCNRDWDAYGVETVDLTAEWREFHGARSTRCIVSQNGDLPFPDETFDLAFSYVVLEHVGTVPPYEYTTEDTQLQRYAYMRNAVAKLRSGGVLIIMTLNKWVPIDPHHGHYYIPWSNWLLKKIGFTITNPFSRKNFLPSPGELDRISGRIATEFDIDYFLITDSNWSFFGTSYPNWVGQIYGCIYKIAPRSWRRYLISHIYYVIRKN